MKTELPRNIIFFDTETREIPEDEETELVLKLGSACYWSREKRRNPEKEEWHEFHDISSFWDFVFSHVKEKTKTYLVAHNVSFDFRVLKGFDEMRARGFESKKLIYSGTTNIWEFRKGTRTICILDNMNFFKSSLASLGESIGVSKMEMPTDDDEALMRYCRNDVHIMVEAWRLFFEFIQVNDLGNFSKTIASQAFSAYRHRFMKTPILIHTWEKVIAIERESYHGGRTECFFIGRAPKRPYFLLDVNSMYPSLMKEQEYPKKILGTFRNVTSNGLSLFLDAYCVTARVVVKTHDPVYAVKHLNRLIFPTGTFETTLTTRELQYALAHGDLIEIKEGAYYEKGILFDEYVSFFYHKRQEFKKNGNDAFSYICKLFLNSLYGKFGQRNEVFEEITPTEYQDIKNIHEEIEDGMFEYYDENNTLIKERRMNGKVERSIGMCEGYHSFVAIAAHITADARMKLWEYLEIAGRKNVYYSDTDSMIVNSLGFLNSKKYISSDLGMLSLKESSHHLVIRGAKDYEFANDVVIKGIRKDAKKLSDDEFEQVRFEGMAGSIRKKRANRMFISTIRKKLSREYKKGVVERSGRVSPIHLTNKGKLW